MTAASQALEWVLGGAFALLGVLVAVEWLRHRGSPSSWLAASMVLLGAVAIIDATATALAFQSEVFTDILLVLFVASGWTFWRFRAALIPVGSRIRAVVDVAAALTVALLLIAYIPGRGPTAPVTPLEAAAALVMLIVWAGCVLEPVVRFWRHSSGLPAVQRSRLRALTLAYSGIIVILALSVVVGIQGGGSHLGLAATSLALVVTPLFYGAYAPPRWLRRLWREREEEQFRSALSDLLLYSPNLATLTGRASEWAARLVGADAALISEEGGAILARYATEPAAEADLVAEPPPLPEEAAAGGVRGAVIRVPLGTHLRRALLLVRAGPLTPVFGEDELARLREYGSALTSAMDRVVLVEQLRRNAALLDLATDAILTWSINSNTITYWNRAAEALYGFSAEEAVGREPG